MGRVTLLGVDGSTLIGNGQVMLTPDPGEVGAALANQSTIMIGLIDVTVYNYTSNKLPAALTQYTTTQTTRKFEYQSGSVREAFRRR